MLLFGKFSTDMMLFTMSEFKYFSCSDKIRNIISTIGSGYHRDLQLTKKPFIEGIHLFKDTVILLTEIIKHLEIKKILKKAMTPDLYVTEKVYDKVNNGESFRDTYFTG